MQWRSTYGLHTVYIRSTYGLHMVYIRSTYGVHTVYSRHGTPYIQPHTCTALYPGLQPAPGVRGGTADVWVCTYTIHTPYIHHTYTIHTPYIHHTYTRHTPYIHHIYTIYTPYIHHIYTIHTLCIHHTYTIHTLDIQHTYTIHTTYIHHTYTIHTPYIHHSVTGSHVSCITPVLLTRILRLIQGCTSAVIISRGLKPLNLSSYNDVVLLF